MGDLSNGHDCNVFIRTFADDLIKKYRSQLLDAALTEQVRYHVMADGNWEVGLYATVKTGKVTDEKEEEEHFRLEQMPLFAPTADDSVSIIAEELDISEEEAARRLHEKVVEMEREEKEYRTQAEREVEEELEGEEDGL